MQQNKQGNNDFVDYEIDPLILFKSLFERKLLIFIFVFTTFISLLSFIYIKSLPQLYSLTTSLIEPEEVASARGHDGALRRRVRQPGATLGAQVVLRLDSTGCEREAGGRCL